jgi:CheY-like chemotaxis protein
VDLFGTRLRRRASEHILQLLLMIALADRALHNGLQRLYGLGVEMRRRHSIEGHHERGGDELASGRRQSVERGGLNLTRVFGFVKQDGVPLATINRLPTGMSRMPAKRHRSDLPAPREQLVLILSNDLVAAVLLGGLVETLGYEVHFAHPPESADDSVRRVKPRICLVDCNDPLSCRTEFFGRAAMRGVSVVIYGTSATLDRVRELARAHNIDTLIMPPGMETLEAALQRAGDP